MTLNLSSLSEKACLDLKNLKSGNTVRVHFKIKEGEKTRVQAFEGVIIAKHNLKDENATITVRRLLQGYGVERIFPLHSPLISKIEVTKIATRVRKSKLYYLRDKVGKAVKLKEKVLNKNLEISLEKVKHLKSIKDIVKDSKNVETEVVAEVAEVKE